MPYEILNLICKKKVFLSLRIESNPCMNFVVGVFQVGRVPVHSIEESGRKFVIFFLPQKKSSSHVFPSWLSDPYKHKHRVVSVSPSPH